MSGSRAAAVVAVATLIAAVHALTTSSIQAGATEMCPPVTMDVLFPPTTWPAPTTIPPETTTTAQPATTTTVASPPPCDPFVYELAWPLAGAGQTGSPFGADRDGGTRKHQGNDIAAPKLTPVVAVADGVVIKVAQEVGTGNCCWAVIGHTDGWQSYYIHLNNDRHGTDDGLGVGARTDLAEGSVVTRGEVIGWVGDSGNAEDTIDHLHLELRNPEGIAVDPGPSLEAARRAAVLLDPQPTWPYADDDGHPGEWTAALLLSQGLLLGCEGSMINFCPDYVAAPDFAGVIATHLAGKAPPPIEGHRQPLPGPMQAMDPRSAEAALGCEPVDECLLVGLPETEVARIAMWIRIDALVATLRPPSPQEEGAPQVFLLTAEEAEARLRAIGARQACNPALDGRRLLTRAETMIRLVSWIQGTNPEPCSPVRPTL